jgi:serine/threonine protein kinase
MNTSVKHRLYEKMVAVSGPHTNIENNTNRDRDGVDIYGSYHFDEFKFTNALRNTLVRFDEFKVPKDLSNYSVVDLASNLGSLSLECLRRNASKVLGFEYHEERVNICNEIASELNRSDRCCFFQMDIEPIIHSADRTNDFISIYGKADIVFCCALDAYVDNYKLYDFVSNITAEICFFETNSKIKKKHFIKYMRDNGFSSVTSIGTSKSDAGFGRESYILDKKILLGERTEEDCKKGPKTYRMAKKYLRRWIPRNVWERLKSRYESEEDYKYNNRSYRLGNKYIRDFHSRALWEKIKCLYKTIKHIPFLQECDFSYPKRLVSPYYSTQLSDMVLSESSKEKIKQQIITLIRMLNQAGIAHRDIHIENLFYQNEQIYLVDLEFIEEDHQPLKECYDLTGQGLESPLNSGHMHVFQDNPRAIKNFIDITMEDFE